MSYTTIKEITQEEIKKNSIAELRSTPNRGGSYGMDGLSAQQLQERFDALPKLIANKLNEVIDGHNALTDETAAIDKKADDIAFDLVAEATARGKAIEAEAQARKTAIEAEENSRNAAIAAEAAARNAALEALKEDILGGASGAYDTLLELEEGLKDNDSDVVAILNAIKDLNIGAGAATKSVQQSGNSAEGYAAVSLGNGTKATGVGSLSAGGVNSNETTDGERTPTAAKGVNSIATGRGTRANSQESATFGLGTIASSDRQFVRGQYNLEDKDGKYVDIVGWGYEKGDGTVGRANIYTLTRKGEAWFQGDVYVGGSNMNWKASKLAKEDDVNNALNSFHGLKGEEKFTEDLPTEIYYNAIDPTYTHDVVEDDGSPDGLKTTVYSFENLIFTTNPSGAYRLSNVYTYLDTWNNRCYTINPNYHPNLKSGESVVTLDESFDPEGMLKSIALEAKFRGEGTYTHGNKDFAFLAGADVVADGNGAASVGKENFVVGSNASSFGEKGFVRAQNGTAMGYNNMVTGRHSVAFNEANRVTGYASAGFGDHNNVFASHSFGCGWQNKTFGQYNFLAGSQLVADGDHIFAFGHKGNYVGSSHIVNGNQNEVNGNYDIADGYKNTIFGDNNNVNGLTNAVGTVLRDGDGNIIAKMPSAFNTVFGMKNKIVRETTEDETEEERNKRQSYGHIINGVENVIDATPSFQNFVNGQYNEITSDVDGNGNRHVASGYSIVSGIYNKVFSRFGSAIGEGLRVLGRSIVQFVIGKYNAPDPDASFIVGSGSSDKNRANSFVIKKDGRAVLGANPVGDMDAATKQYVDEHIGPNLYEHTVTIVSTITATCHISLSFVSTDVAELNDFSKLSEFLRLNGKKAASGLVKNATYEVVPSYIEYVGGYISVYGIHKSISSGDMSFGSMGISSSGAFKFVDRVRTIF